MPKDMETFFCRRYRAGVATDELKLVAANTADAEIQVRRFFRTLGIDHMDWGQEFAALEDASGKVVATWRDGGAFA
jgi:hypothetical protein